MNILQCILGRIMKLTNLGTLSWRTSCCAMLNRKLRRKNVSYEPILSESRYRLFEETIKQNRDRRTTRNYESESINGITEFIVQEAFLEQGKRVVREKVKATLSTNNNLMMIIMKVGLPANVCNYSANFIIDVMTN